MVNASNSTDHTNSDFHYDLKFLPKEDYKVTSSKDKTTGETVLEIKSELNGRSIKIVAPAEKEGQITEEFTKKLTALNDFIRPLSGGKENSFHHYFGAETEQLLMLGSNHSKEEFKALNIKIPEVEKRSSEISNLKKNAVSNIKKIAGKILSFLDSLPKKAPKPLPQSPTENVVRPQSKSSLSPSAWVDGTKKETVNIDTQRSTPPLAKSAAEEKVATKLGSYAATPGKLEKRLEEKIPTEWNFEELKLLLEERPGAAKALADGLIKNMKETDMNAESPTVKFQRLFQAGTAEQKQAFAEVLVEKMSSEDKDENKASLDTFKTLYFQTVGDNDKEILVDALAPAISNIKLDDSKQFNEIGQMFSEIFKDSTTSVNQKTILFDSFIEYSSKKLNNNPANDKLLKEIGTAIEKDQVAAIRKGVASEIESWTELALKYQEKA